MKKLFLAVITFCTISTQAQTFPVGHMSVNFKDVSRTGGYSISGGVTTNTANGRDIGAEVYYPATVSGNNQPVASGQFPIVVFGHGFVMGWDSYDNIYNQLAAKGYIVLLPRTEGSFSPNHGDFGNDLKFLAAAGLNLNSVTTPSSLTVFNGKVLQKAAIGGHSMGAGSSYLAAANNNNIECMFNCAAATTNPSSINSASLITVPTLVISGARDCVADTTVQNNHYVALASTKKFHVILKQLTHCDFGDGSNSNCVLGQSTSGCGNQVSNSLAFPRYMNYIEPFLAAHLKNDCNEAQRFMDSVNAVSSLRAGVKKQGTIICTTTNLNTIQSNNDIMIYPNPTTENINIKISLQQNERILLKLYDILGKEISVEQSGENGQIILNTSLLEDGLYTLVVYHKQSTQSYKIIKNSN
jgi:dienelactone hydrolase